VWPPSHRAIDAAERAQGTSARRLPPDLGERQAGAVAPNVLDRIFQAPAPNRKWIGDFTWTAEGWLYVAIVLDLFSRRIVGWSMSASMTAQLVTDALVIALWRRGKPAALLHHSDQGSQYTSEQFQRLLAENGVTCSMSRSGNVWDNAAMESLFSSLKTERNASTIQSAGIRRWATSARWSSKCRRNQLRMVSTKPGAGQSAVVTSVRDHICTAAWPRLSEGIVVRARQIV
jgi:transposase InsO family protein